MYGGLSLLIEGQNADFGNDLYHDRAESAKVVGTCTWLAYSDWFDGQVMIIERNYADLAAYKNMFSSARGLPPAGTAAIALFADPNYRGRMVILYTSNSYLTSVDFDDQMSSFIVVAGTWTLYKDPNYYGRSVNYEAGTKSSGPGSLGHDTVSSVKLN